MSNKLEIAAYVSPTVGFPPKSGTWQFLQDAYNEQFKILLRQMIGVAYDATKVYLVYGCVYTPGPGPSDLTFTEGALFFNGEIYFSPAQVVSTGGGPLVADLTVSQYGVNADPVVFTNGTPHDVHNIRRITWVESFGTGTLTGTAASDYTALVKGLENWTDITTFGTNWGASSPAPAYKKDLFNNRVDITGYAVTTGTSAGAVVLTVPAGFRPVRGGLGISCVMLDGNTLVASVVPLILGTTGVLQFLNASDVPTTSNVALILPDISYPIA